LPNRSNVSGVLDALKAVANLPADTEIPSWIGASDFPQPENLIAFDNGLLDLKRTVAGDDAPLMDHTPRWFSTNCLRHSFDPEATCPKWTEFLNQVFEEDEERIRALAQWFGYCLTLDIRQQKFAMLIGPPRSGKGTITTILAALLGDENVAYPNLNAIGKQFGLATLIGKQAAIVPDAHLGRYSDSIAILERLKSIVGGDPQNVDRKGLPELSNVLIRSRFTICVNEMPRLPDASAALRSRLLLIPFHRSFEGRENLNLGRELLKEIQGITNWALDGLRDLRSTGRLLQPKAGEDILKEFVRLSSPVKAFLEDCCVTSREESTTTDLIQRAWQRWCLENGHEPGSNAGFGAKLHAALPQVKRVRLRDDGELTYFYRGLALTDEWEAKANNPGY
jgi:putative DNA primase/helicase